jgi:hypothetical protein
MQRDRVDGLIVNAASDHNVHAQLITGRTSRRLSRKIEKLFAHLKRILKLDRLRLRGPNGALDEFILAATAQNLRKMVQAAPDTQP